MGKLPIDSVPSTSWAIADYFSLQGGALTISGGWYPFDLFNRYTGRAHRLHFIALGFGVGTVPGNFDLGMNFALNYNYFTTSRPVTFDDFDGCSGKIGSAALLFANGSSFTVYDSNRPKTKKPSIPLPLFAPDFDFSSILIDEVFASWGIGLPSVSVMRGTTKIEYGGGTPLGEPAKVDEPKLDIAPTPDDLDINIRMTQQQQKIVATLPGDVLFDFDKSHIKPNAKAVLDQMGAIMLRSPRLVSIEIEGHTDSIGDPVYNKTKLSVNRANAVLSYFAKNGFIRPNIRIKPPVGVGAENPVARNKKPDGSDDPEGRRKNRRVEIHLWYH